MFFLCLYEDKEGMIPRRRKIDRVHLTKKGQNYSNYFYEQNTDTKEVNRKKTEKENEM
jgi:hypothetical protein